MAESVISSDSLSETILQGCDVFFDLVCDPCNEDGIQAEAGGFCVNCNDYMCSSCIRAHRRNKASRTHVIKDKQHMPQTKPQKTITVATDTSTEKCDQHPEESIKYFCNDHTILGCTVCITMDHRMCEDVNYIPDLIDGLLDSQEYKYLGKELKELMGKSQYFMKRAKSNVAKTEKFPTKVIRSVHEFQKRVIETFNRHEMEMKNQTEVMKSKDLEKMKHISDAVNGILDEIDDLTLDIENLKKTDQLCQLFILMKTTEDRLVSWNISLDEADSENYIETYMFEAGPEIEQIIDGPTQGLGMLSTCSNVSDDDKDDDDDTIVLNDANVYAEVPLKLPSPSLVPEETLPIKHSDRIPESQTSIPLVKGKVQPISAVPLPTEKQNQILSGDHNTITAQQLYDIDIALTTNSYINCLALLQGDKLVLSDNLSNQIKLVNLQSRTVTSELAVPSRARDIAAIGKQAAVTLPQDRKILFVRVAEYGMRLSKKVTERLAIEKEIMVDGACESVEYNSGKLFVFCTHPVKVEILSPDGTVERRIEKFNDGTDLFIYPQYLAVSPSGETMYVSDYGDNSVTALALDGTVKAQCKDLDSPTGVAVDQNGRVLVAEGSCSGRVSLLTQDCRKVKVIADELRDISSICYCQETARLFVGIYDRGVSVYQLQGSE